MIEDFNAGLCRQIGALFLNCRRIAEPVEHDIHAGFGQDLCDPKANAANIAQLMQYYADGKIKPLISETFPLERAGEAIAKLGARKAVGKIVVTME